MAASEEERASYNALAVSGTGYAAMRGMLARWGSWKECWNRHGRGGADPGREWSRLLHGNIGLVMPGDAGYPPLLAEIPNPPLGIYFKGNIAAAGVPTIAVVGTRRASAAGKRLAERFGAAIAGTGLSVASGLALGIDAAAHAGAISVRGLTVAVMANGLDRIYPPPNLPVANDILENGGALVSEYPPGSPPLRRRFIERNRLVSGLSLAVLAIEVPERSGVLATVRFALDQNRDVFVVPGPPEHPNYLGSHRLIRAGANLAARPEDLLEDLGFGIERGGNGLPPAIDETTGAATLTSSKAGEKSFS